MVSVLLVVLALVTLTAAFFCKEEDDACQQRAQAKADQYCPSIQAGFVALLKTKKGSDKPGDRAGLLALFLSWCKHAVIAALDGNGTLAETIVACSRDIAEHEGHSVLCLDVNGLPFI